MTNETRTSAEIKADLENYQPCSKCGGSGTYVAKTSGRAYECSVCFGHGRTMKPAVKRAMRAAMAAEQEAARAPLMPWIEELRAAAAALSIPDPESDEQWTYAERSAMRTHQLLTSIAAQAYNKGSVTDAQRAAANAAVARLTAPAPEVIPVPTGRQQVTGRIVSVKEVENQYGVTMKVLVADDRGFRVFGTRAASMLVPCETGYIDGSDGRRYRPASVGDRVTFVATIEPSHDRGFGFYSRPAKARAAE